MARIGIDKAELCVSLALVALGLFVAIGAAGLTASAGYSRISPRFFPALVAVGLIGVGAFLAVQCVRGGWPRRGEDAARAALHAPAFLYISAGAGAHMALIASIGFVPASALLFTLVARAFGSDRLLRDAAVGLALASLAYAFFTQVVSVNLPSGTLFEARGK